MNNWGLTELIHRLRSIVTRGHVTRNRVGKKHRELHVQYWVDTDTQKIPFLQNAGFCVNPGTGKGIEVVTLDPESDPSHRIAIVVTGERVPDCEEGELCLFAPRELGNKIKLNDGGICIEANGQDLLGEIVTALTALNGPTIANGALTPVINNINEMRC